MSISPSLRPTQVDPPAVHAHRQEHRITIAGEFEPVALVLCTMRSSITVIENTETHLLFTIAGGGAGIARPASDDTVEVTVLETQSQQVAERVAAALGAVLDYPVALQRQPDEPPTDRYASTFDPGTAVLSIRGEVDETDIDHVRDDLRDHSHEYTHPLTVDLTAVTFLPSRAIGVIIAAQKAARANSAEISLTAAAGSISDKVLSILSLPHQMS